LISVEPSRAERQEERTGLLHIPGVEDRFDRSGSGVLAVTIGLRHQTAEIHGGQGQHEVDEVAPEFLVVEDLEPALEEVDAPVVYVEVAIDSARAF